MWTARQWNKWRQELVLSNMLEQGYITQEEHDEAVAQELVFERAEGEDAPQEPEKKPYKPYSRKARLWAWVGIAFMVFLTIMYAYSFASGSILMF